MLKVETESPFDLVILVDDSRIDRIINKRAIESSCMANKVLEFNKASKALEYLLSVDTCGSQDEDIPSVIFVDLLMPAMNGFQFIEEFEKLSGKIKSKAKIVVLSNSITALDTQRIYQYKNVLKFMHKPLIKSNIINLFREPAGLFRFRQIA